MADTSIPGRKSGLFSTLRKDSWWVGSVLTLLGFGAFVVYTTWAAMQGEFYWAGANVYAGDYLSPFYSPPLFIDPSVNGAAPMVHSLLGTFPDWWPTLPLLRSPALLILMFPGLFRFTCYYYRGAYYKAFAATPPACAVGGIPRKKFIGETGLFLFQNLHRYAMYFAVVFVFILSYDAYLGFWQTSNVDNVATFGIGVGSIVLLLNPIFIGLYTFGCHSFRHLVGGGKDCFSCGSGLRKGIYDKVSWLNRNHKLFAWISLFWVGITDAYVRLVSMGIITDFNTWG